MTSRIHSFKEIPKRETAQRAALAAAGLFAIAACVTEPVPPDQEMQAAAQAITSAEQARVADYASPELGEARDKLAAANAAAQQKNMVEAKRLAEQARLDAELATARASVIKATTVNDEMKKGTKSLQQEMQRNTGITQ